MKTRPAVWRVLQYIGDEPSDVVNQRAREASGGEARNYGRRARPLTRGEDRFVLGTKVVEEVSRRQSCESAVLLDGTRVATLGGESQSGIDQCVLRHG